MSLAFFVSLAQRHDTSACTRPYRVPESVLSRAHTRLSVSPARYLQWAESAIESGRRLQRIKSRDL